MKTTRVITIVQRKGMGEKGLRWAECISRKQNRGGEYPDLCRTVQNAADELDHLLHSLNWLTGHEVLLVGCVEDDNRRHCHLAEKNRNRKYSF